MEINFKQLFLILNRVKIQDEKDLRDKATKTGLELGGLIYEDPVVSEYDMEGRPLIELPSDAVSVKELTKIVEKILKLQ